MSPQLSGEMKTLISLADTVTGTAYTTRVGCLHPYRWEVRSFSWRSVKLKNKSCPT